MIGFHARASGVRGLLEQLGMKSAMGRWCMRRRRNGKQHDMERAAASRHGSGPQPAAVGGDDRARDVQAEAKPLRLGRVERLKQLAARLVAEPAAPVEDRDLYARI